MPDINWFAQLFVVPFLWQVSHIVGPASFKFWWLMFTPPAVRKTIFHLASIKTRNLPA
jgi:hypothetical protein